MKHITFYLDFLSPYAYLAFEKLPEALEGLSYSVAYKPLLLGALLKQHGTLGPAEVPAKRAWTYRHVHWCFLLSGQCAYFKWLRCRPNKSGTRWLYRLFVWNRKCARYCC